MALSPSRGAPEPKAAGANTIKGSLPSTTFSTSSFHPPMNYRPGGGPGHRAAGLTLKRHIAGNFAGKYRLVLFRRCHSQVGGRKNRENDRLHESHKQVQGDEQQRYHRGDIPTTYSRNVRLLPTNRVACTSRLKNTP